MDRLDFQTIEKKWQEVWKIKIYIDQRKIKNFTASKCFRILQAKFIWDM